MRVTEGVTHHEAVYKKKTAVGVTTLYWKPSEMQLPGNRRGTLLC